MHWSYDKCKADGVKYIANYEAEKKEQSEVGAKELAQRGARPERPTHDYFYHGDPLETTNGKQCRIHLGKGFVQQNIQKRDNQLQYQDGYLYYPSSWQVFDPSNVKFPDMKTTEVTPNHPNSTKQHVFTRFNRFIVLYDSTWKIKATVEFDAKIFGPTSAMRLESIITYL
jgi:hypothetical protein